LPLKAERLVAEKVRERENFAKLIELRESLVVKVS
jgi:hypothetical protein